MTSNEPESKRVRRRFEMAVRRYALDHELLPAGCRVLVAVSGGPDSTALLLALAQLSHRGGFGLAVAHFDHGLRGREAAAREDGFVRELALSLGLPCYAGAADVRARARKSKQSIEAAARDERYSFLAGAAREAECDRVATGHTATDQAETVLMHVIRGSGLGGLAGMSPRSALPVGGSNDVILVRPMLRLTRDDTRAYCSAHGIEPIEDESNLLTEFQRNRVRHQLVPALREYNRRIEEALVRLADAAREDNAYLDAIAAQGVETTPEDGACISRLLLESWPVSLRRRGLVAAVALLLGDAQGLGERHLLALDRLALEGQTGDRLDLPRGVSASLTREALVLNAAQEADLLLPEAAVVFSIPGETRFGSVRVCASAAALPTGTVAEVDAAAAGQSICIRRRLPGDRFQPLGMSESKKLQDFFVDEHVPRGERDDVPIFETQNGIIWVGGLRIAEWARPRQGHQTIHLSYVSV